MTRYFIRTLDQDAFVEAGSLDEACVEFVRETPLDQLGATLMVHTEWFGAGAANIPGDTIGIRTTIPLVKACIWTEDQAKDFNEQNFGTRIV